MANVYIPVMFVEKAWGERKEDFGTNCLLFLLSKNKKGFDITLSVENGYQPLSIFCSLSLNLSFTHSLCLYFLLLPFDPSLPSLSMDASNIYIYIYMFYSEAGWHWLMFQVNVCIECHHLADFAGSFSVQDASLSSSIL